MSYAFGSENGLRRMPFRTVVLLPMMVCFKVQSKPFYEFTVRCTQVAEGSPHKDPVFKIMNNTLMLVELPIVASARNISSIQKYAISLSIFKRFYLVTDSAAVTERVSNASISSDLPVKTRIDCRAHFSII